MAGAVPILLLPFRLETRFVEAPAGLQLWVRVYPDQIAVDAHEPELTEVEHRAGRAYWQARWDAAGDPAAGRGPWRALAAAFGPRRAAWIARALQPENWPQPGHPPPGGPAAGGPGRFPAGGPRFPDPPRGTRGRRRAGSWERAAVARALPERWVLFAYAAGAAAPTRHVFPHPVRQGLAVGPDPTASAGGGAAARELDPGLRWLTDFDEAERAGMAVRLPDLPAPARERGFDRLVLVGRRPGDGSRELSDLLDAHHYTDGLAFVPQGAPTKSTPDAESAFSERDPGFEASYRTEQEEGLIEPPAAGGPGLGSDGWLASAALGIEAAVFEHVGHADGHGIRNARDMAVALWPATLGYLLTQMTGLRPLAEPARNWFVGHVRGRGPLPALRAGDTPYGLLPVASVRSLPPAPPVEKGHAPDAVLPRLLEIWKRAARASPRIAAGGDPDAALTAVLEMAASAQTYRARWVLGPEVVWSLMGFLGLPDRLMARWWQENRAASRRQLAELGLSAFLAQGAPLTESALAPESAGLPYPAVAAPPLSETEPLPRVYRVTGAGGEEIACNCIEWLYLAPLSSLRAGRPDGGPAPDTLLFKLLRHALLRAYADAALSAQVAAGQMRPAEVREAELVDMAAPTPTAWDALQRPVPGLTAANQGMGSYLQAEVVARALSGGRHPGFAPLQQLVRALRRLAALPTAELDRLLGETLDVCSHRLDAWITSVATARLGRVRQQRPSGIALGGYGWVEGVVPRRRPAPVGGGEAAAVDELFAGSSRARPPVVYEPSGDNGGFIHAPSAAQGAAAAVLRAAYLSHRSSSDGRVGAIDLSSERVRAALSLLDGVRRGEPLGALLGCAFEQALLAAAAGPGLSELGTFVPAFRSRYPLVANKLTQAPAPPAVAEAAVPAVAAPNVVDGLALLRDWQAGDGTLAWGAPLPAAGSPEQAAVDGILRRLDGMLDAVGDLSLAEGVFQVVRGNPGRAGGLLHAAARGERPPEVESVVTPRGGTDQTHRLLIVFPGDVRGAPAAPWTTGAANPRAAAEPWLDAWLRTLLPDPKRVRCRVVWGPEPAPGGTPQGIGVTLDDLGAGPLDLLTMADPVARAPGRRTGTRQRSELELRALDYALFRAPAGVPAGAADMRVRLDRDPAWDRSVITVPQALVMARALRDLTAQARPLGAADLAAPSGAGGLPGRAPVDLADLRDRVTAVQGALGPAGRALETATGALRQALTNPGRGGLDALARGVRTALLAASWFGVADALAEPPALVGAGPDTAVAGVRVQIGPASPAGHGLDLRVHFTARTALQRGRDTISLLGPEGITWPDRADAYRMAVGGGTPQRAAAVGGTGAIARVTVPESIPPGAAVTLVARLAPDLLAHLPPAGRYTLALATSQDRRAQVSLPFRTGDAADVTAVTAVTVEVAIPAAGQASAYTVRLRTTAGAGPAATATILTLAGPAGTVFPGDASAYAVTVDGVGVPTVAAAPAGSSVRLRTAPIGARLGVRVVAAGVISPAAGTYALAVSTSADAAAASSRPYVIGDGGLAALADRGGRVRFELRRRLAAAPAAVTGVQVHLRAGTAGMDGETYQVAFTAGPEGGALQPGATIVLTGPDGTGFSPAASDYAVAAGGGHGAIVAGVSVAPVGGGATANRAVIRLGASSLEAGDAIRVSAGGVKSPPAPGTYSLAVSTSAETVAAAAAFTLDGPAPGTAVAGASLTLDPPQPVAGGLVRCTVTFTATTGTGPGAAGTTVTLLAPPGAGLPADGSAYAVRVGGAPVAVARLEVAGGTAELTLRAVPAAAAVEVAVAGVKSPAAGAYTLGVRTSADPRVASAGAFPVAPGADELIAALRAMLGRDLPVLPRFVPSNGTELGWALTPSAQAGLLAGAGGGRQAPHGWLQQLTHVRPAAARLDLALDLGQVLAGAAAPAITLAQSPHLPGEAWLALPSRPGVTAVRAVPATPVAGRSSDYGLTFVTSDHGALTAASTITLTLPAGTALPPAAADYRVALATGGGDVPVDSVTLSSAYGSPVPNVAQLTLAPRAAIAAASAVAVTVSGVVNPGAAGPAYTAAVATAADPEPAVSAPYVIAGPAGAGPACTPARGRVALAMVVWPGAGASALGRVLPAGPISGLVVDEWTERVPAATQPTALVFHYEEPLARAPQALLLAVPPPAAGPDDRGAQDDELGRLGEVVSETLDLAKVRTVDPGTLPAGGQLLPAVYLAFNAAGDTVSTLLTEAGAGMPGGVVPPRFG